jgi:hypothetical protein
MINIGVLSAASIIIDETLPLFLKADISDGGLSFSSFHIGLLIAISSFIMVSINIILSLIYVLLPLLHEGTVLLVILYLSYIPHVFSYQHKYTIYLSFLSYHI